MNKQHFYSILSTYDLDQLVKFVNDNTDPFSGLDMQKIYNLSDEIEREDFLHDLVNYSDYSFVKRTMNMIKDTDKYIEVIEDEILIFNTIEEFLNFHSLDFLYEWTKEWEYEDIVWAD